MSKGKILNEKFQEKDNLAKKNVFEKRLFSDHHFFIKKDPLVPLVTFNICPLDRMQSTSWSPSSSSLSHKGKKS